MKKLLPSALTLAAILALTPMAQATDGWYGRADVGYSVGGGVKLSTGDESDKLKHKDNFLGLLGVGYAFKNGFRLEGEFAGRYNKEEFEGADVGSTRVWSAMANGYYDFNKGGKVQPYLGVGIGAAKVGLKIPALAISDNDTHFAYQGLAGVAFALTSQLTLDLGYRYLRVDDLKYRGSFNDCDGPCPVDFKAKYDQHAVTAGLRWQFAPPPPPPAPPPPPVVTPPVVQVCPAQDFKVYFEWDRSDLNAAGSDTINAAAARAKACNVSTVVVKGYTDTSGSAKYNLGLSNRRAAVVRDALVAAGIPTALISTEGLGETNLDKQTKDGVREPLNRRTAVTISFQ